MGKELMRGIVSLLRTHLRLFTHSLMLPVLENGEETTLVGGQAVMEGVMMRAPHSYCVAVRKASGVIVTEEKPLPRMSEMYPIFKYPVFRGVGTLYQAMKLGMKALQFSANVAIEDLPQEPGKQGAKERPKEIPKWAMMANLALMLGSFIFLYKFLPLYLATRLEHVYPVLSGRWAFNLTDGVIRIAIFLGFMILISRMKDIRRVFEFHGAEHKVVFNFESGKPVTVENAQQFTTFHPRCGTSFLFVMMLISMLVYTIDSVRRVSRRNSSMRIALLPLIIGPQLRADPLRRQTPRLVPGHC